MADNQGGIQDIKEINNTAQSMMSKMQGAVPAYAFGDITRVGKLSQGGDISKIPQINVEQLFADNNRVGMNPFNNLAHGETITLMG